jgi:ubiquinone/menaquinone biosynthesis C-methylase UbiE
MNVLIHQFHDDSAAVDAAALTQFQQQWATYRKLVDNDHLSHRAIGTLLHTTLNEMFTSPFSFLDIACGDASMMKNALQGTQVCHYHGIDLSQSALDLAVTHLGDAPFEVDLDRRDFVEAMLRRPKHADAAWCSLSIHHLMTADKRRLIKAIRNAIGSRGIFLLYEPTWRPDETREAWLARFSRVNQSAWNVLSVAEWGQIWQHVSACDFPETAERWCEIGREAGFNSAREMFVNPTGFFSLFRFEP